MSASASTLPRRKSAAKRNKRKKRASGWSIWWPLALGIAVTPVAVKAATLMALTGPDGLRILYPWMLLPKLHFLGLADPDSGSISQALLYFQFPVYGVLSALIYRWKGAVAAILQLMLLHLLAVGLVFVAERV